MNTVSKRVERAVVERYSAILVEPSRPPAKGGNTSAMHQHRLKIGDHVFSFLARGSRRWVFAKDLVSFDWDFDASSTYRNIIVETIETWDSSGHSVVRGDRRSKAKWRSAPARMPASRREQRD